MDLGSILAGFQTLWTQAQAFFFEHALSWAMAAQLAVIAGALLLARNLSKKMAASLTQEQAHLAERPEAVADLVALLAFVRVIEAFAAFLLVALGFAVAGHFHWPRQVLDAAGLLLIALTLTHLFTDEMKNRFWAKVVIVAIWSYAASLVLGLKDFWFHFLQGVTFQFGKVSISLFFIQRALVLLLALYWISKALRIFLHFWLIAKSRLTPALQILVSRLGGIFLYTACIVIVLHYLGLDLTVFALFSGALGLGLGFGLQKIFANLVSGFILLADKSIKPGDVIQLKDSYGWINFLGSRYVSVVTRDGIEHLIPNESLITGEVINWSYSENLVRLRMPVGVAYGSDLEKARELMLAAAADTPRILKDPGPVCLITGFGDSAINLEVRSWINDPQNGIGSVKSALFWGIWRRFREHDIETPNPQRDVHLKSIPEITFRTRTEED